MYTTTFLALILIKEYKKGKTGNIFLWLIQSDLMTAENWLWVRNLILLHGKACVDGMDRISFLPKGHLVQFVRFKTLNLYLNRQLDIRGWNKVVLSTFARDSCYLKTYPWSFATTSNPLRRWWDGQIFSFTPGSLTYTHSTCSMQIIQIVNVFSIFIPSLFSVHRNLYYLQS